MKKALNLLLGLSLMASAYAKAPAFKPTIASLPPAPISPTGSIALQAYDYEYVFAYSAVNEGPYVGGDPGDSVYMISISFQQVILSDDTQTPIVPNIGITLNITSGPLAGDQLDWPAGQGIYSFEYPLTGGSPTASFTATTSPTTYQGWPIVQAVYWLGVFEDF